MSIEKKPRKDLAEAFIAGAPDAAPSKKAVGVKRGMRRQIAMTFPPATIDSIDATAARFGMSRAAYVNRAVVLALEADAI